MLLHLSKPMETAGHDAREPLLAYTDRERPGQRKQLSAHAITSVVSSGRTMDLRTFEWLSHPAVPGLIVVSLEVVDQVTERCNFGQTSSGFSRKRKRGEGDSAQCLLEP
jgi:hypothetical protein